MKTMDHNDDDTSKNKDNAWKKENILKFGTWNVQGISHKEGQLDDILAKKNISIAVISETKKKLKGSKETENYLQFYSGVDSKSRARAGIMIMVHKRFRHVINHYYYWNERMIQLRLKLQRGYLTVIGIYAPVEGKEEDNNEFYSNLQKIVNKVNKTDMLLIMGDFNARVGNIKIDQSVGTHGEEICNNNGNRLIDFVMYNQLKIMNTMFEHKESHKYTWEARNSKSIIDYIICNFKLSDMVLDTRVFRGQELETDHYLLISPVRLKPRWLKRKKKTNIRNSNLIFKVSLLRDFSIANLYKNRLDDLVDQLPPHDNVEDEWLNLIQILTQAANESLGHKKTWCRKKGLRQWDDEINKIIADKRQAYKKYISTKKEEDKIDYHKKRAIAKREVRKKHRQNWINFVAYLENDITRPQPQTYKILKKLNNEVKEDLRISVISQDTWLQYFQQLWSTSTQALKLPFSANLLMELISLDELQRVLDKLKNNKSPGEDSINNELFKYASSKFLQRFLRFLNLIWEGQEIPERWTKSIVIPIHKTGDIKITDNYRGISLLNTGYKIYANILKNKLYVHYENIISEEQNGFRRGRSCCDGYFTLKLLVEKHREFNLETHVAFIDFKKAFDTVNRNKLLQILADDQVPQQIIQNIYNIYKTTIIAIRSNNKLSQWQPIYSGVRQGCGLSPLLFIIYMNRIIQDWRQTRHGFISINRNLQLDALLFADDLILLASNEDDLQYSVHNLNITSKQYDMEINLEKTKIMAFCGKFPIPSKICLNNRILERVNTFNYLGYTVSPYDEVDIAEKICKYNKTMGVINKIMKPSLVQRHTRLGLYKTLAQPVLRYGSEAWTVKNKDVSRITASEMRFMRATAGYTRWDHKRNEDIMHELQVEPIIQFIRKYQLQWKNHLERMDRYRIPRAMFHYHPHGKRSLGRPKKRWTENSSLRP